MNDSTFNAHEYFQKIYERPVILEAKQLSQVFKHGQTERTVLNKLCLLYTSPSPRDRQKSRMPSSA